MSGTYTPDETGIAKIRVIVTLPENGGGWPKTKALLIETLHGVTQEEAKYRLARVKERNSAQMQFQGTWEIYPVSL